MKKYVWAAVIAIFIWAGTAFAAEECRDWARTNPPEECTGGSVAGSVMISSYEMLIYCKDGHALLYVWDGRKWTVATHYDVEEAKIYSDCMVYQKCEEFLSRIKEASECIDGKTIKNK